MNKIKLCKPYDAIDYLDSKEDYALYLQSCFENDPGDCSLIKSAILDIAQAKGLAEVARESGLAGDCLCKALGSEGRLEFERIAKFLSDMGLSMSDLVRMTPAKPMCEGNVPNSTDAPNKETIEAMDEKPEKLQGCSSFDALLKEIDEEIAEERSSK